MKETGGNETVRGSWTTTAQT